MKNIPLLSRRSRYLGLYQQLMRLGARLTRLTEARLRDTPQYRHTLHAYETTLASIRVIQGR